MKKFGCLKAAFIFNFLEISNGIMCSKQFMLLDRQRYIHESQRKTS